MTSFTYRDEEKRAITTEFARNLHALQQEHIGINEPVYSNTTVNSMSNTLEAVFLHGLKPRVTRKLATYLISQLSDEKPVFTFWAFIKKFTHQDVISQLMHLGQISTEIGMCRAWIRIALNDGVMESYIDTIQAYPTMLEQYYELWAYLRDIEQPEILKTYLRGLGEFQFKLSYNSSVLNVWTQGPSVLQTVFEHRSPPAVIAPIDITDRYDNKETSPIKVKHKTHGSSPRVERGCEAMNYEFMGASNTTTNTSAAHYKLENTDTIIDSTEIIGCSPDASTSSQISCPDPPTARLQSCDDARDFGSYSSQGSATYSPGNTERHGFTSKLNTFNQPTYEEVETGIHGIAVEDATNLMKSEDANTQGDDVNSGASNIYKNENLHLIPTGLDSSITNSHKEINVKQAVPIEAPVTDVATECLKHMVVTDGVSEALKQAADERLQGLKIEQDKNELKEQNPGVPSDSSYFIITEDSNNSIDIASSNTLEPAEELKSGLSIPKQLHENTTPQQTEMPDDKTDHSMPSMLSNSFGNRLGSKEGWSSTFDPDIVKAVRRTSVNDDTHDPQKDISYGSVLQTYEPATGFQSTTTVQQLIDDLPHTPSAPYTVTTAQECSPDISTDFEFISLYPSAEFAYSDLKAYEAQLAILTQLCHEKGLDAQNFQCWFCAQPIGFIYGSPRVCKFDGGYYCRECHNNDEYVIPAKVLNNWDFTKYKVSKHNRKFLIEVDMHPTINIEQLNPKLYKHVRDLNEIKGLRIQLLYLKSYIFTCQMSVAEDWRRLIWPKEYLYDSIHLYSMSDLCQVPNGLLAQFLRKIIRFGVKHVLECRLCSQKGFICELCHNPKVIYPFQTDSTYRCRHCKAVYHKTCKTSKQPCPKCQRRMSRRSTHSSDTSSIDTIDYASSPVRLLDHTNQGR